MYEITIVIPLYNEEEIVSELNNRLNKICNQLKNEYNLSEQQIEIIFVNDGSSDSTLKLMRAICENTPHRALVNLSRNFGHQIAITAGMEFAKGNHIVVMDADLQDPPELIPKMYAKCLEGYDVVYAKRVKREKDTWFKRITANMFYELINLLTKTNIPKDVGDFRMMKKPVVEVLNSMPEKHRFIRGLVAWMGYNQTDVEYERPERFAGETKYPFRKMFKLSIDAITGFSSFPLKLATYFGVILTILGFSYGMVVLFLYFFTDSLIKGWATVVMLIIFTTGIQFLMLGLIGEYIGRIYIEAKNRPLYIVKDIFVKQTKTEAADE